MVCAKRGLVAAVILMDYLFCIDSTSLCYAHHERGRGSSKQGNSFTFLCIIGLCVQAMQIEGSGIKDKSIKPHSSCLSAIARRATAGSVVAVGDEVEWIRTTDVAKDSGTIVSDE